jgi:hypothetical protein
LRLFKAFRTDCVDSKEAVFFLWADGEQEAFDGIANIRSKDNCFIDYLFNDSSLDEILEDLEGNEHIFGALMEGKKTFANEVFRLTDLKQWQVEEYFVPKEHHLFVAYSKDITDVDDAQLIAVPFDVQDVEGYVVDQLAEKESQEEHFREYVEDKAVNMSFNERFFYEDNEWIFESNPPLRVRENIKYRAAFDEVTVDEYVDSLWLLNVDKFFEDITFRKQYINYITNVEEPSFSDEFYFYVCKKLIKDKDWTEFEIEQV